jgi:hypothetical protein
LKDADEAAHFFHCLVEDRVGVLNNTHEAAGYGLA